MRLIDADAYAEEMRVRQNACLDILAKVSEEVTYSAQQYWNTIFATYAEAKLTLDAMPTVGGWMSVKGMMPDEDEEVLVYYNEPGNQYITIALATNNEFISRDFNCGSFVTHWRPLPKPPEMGGKQDAAD